MRLASKGVLGRHDFVPTKATGIVGGEAVEQTGLSAAGHHKAVQSGLRHLLQHFHGTGHLGRFGIVVELLAFEGIDAIDLFLGGAAAKLPLGDPVDGGDSGATFVHEGFYLGELQTEVVTHLCPRLGVGGHGVKQDAIHVEKHSTEGQAAVGEVEPFGTCLPGQVGMGRPVLLQGRIHWGGGVEDEGKGTAPLCFYKGRE